MDESNKLLEVIHNDQLSMKEEIRAGNAELDKIRTVLTDQFTFAKDLANIEALRAETESLQDIERQQEEARGATGLLPAIERAETSTKGFFDNMGRGILGGLRMPTFSGALRGGLLTAIGYKFGDQIGEFLSRELDTILTAAGFSQDLTDAFTEKVEEYTGPVLMGAGIGSLFGPKGLVIGAIAGYLYKWTGMGELYSDLEKASSEEEKQKLWREFGNSLIDKLQENPVPALLLAGSLFGVKGILVAGVAGYLYESLGLERLFNGEGRKEFANDIYNAVMNKVMGRPIPVDQEELSELNNIPLMLRTPEQQQRISELNQQAIVGGDNSFLTDQALEAAQFTTRRRLIARATQGAPRSRFGLATTTQTTTTAVERAAREGVEETLEAGGERVVREISEAGVERFRDTATGRFIGREAAEQILETGGKEVAEQAAETIAVTTTKTILKKLPIGIGLAFSVPFAIGRAMKGDYVGAGLELAEGAAAIVPGYGTAASYAIAGGSMARDISRELGGTGVVEPAVGTNQLAPLAADLQGGSTINARGGDTTIINNNTNMTSGSGTTNSPSFRVSDGYVAGRL